MTTPFSAPEDDADAARRTDLEHVAAWAAAVVSRASGGQRDALPGIVSPLEFRAEFAVNAKSDAASVSLGNGLVRLARGSSLPASGVLTLTLRWSPGYRADGLSQGDALGDGWTVTSVGPVFLELQRAALDAGHREATLPVITIVKPSGAEAGDEFTARLWGEAAECGDPVIRGWARG